jgi:hypothetical protein
VDSNLLDTNLASPPRSPTIASQVSDATHMADSSAPEVFSPVRSLGSHSHPTSLTVEAVHGAIPSTLERTGSSQSATSATQIQDSSQTDEVTSILCKRITLLIDVEDKRDPALRP